MSNSECVCFGEGFFIGEERKTPRHQESHQKDKFPLLPNLKIIMPDSTSLFCFSWAKETHTFVLFAFWHLFYSYYSIYTILTLSWFIFILKQEKYINPFCFKILNTIHHLNICDKKSHQNWSSIMPTQPHIFFT